METLNTRQRKQKVYDLDQMYFHRTVANHLWAHNSGKSGPTVGLLEATHGNESKKLEILGTIMALLEKHGVQFGKVISGIGNPGAYINGSRGVHNDLNRCFGSAQLPPKQYETKRAAQLKPHLATMDVLFDNHATIKPSQPFLVIPQIQHALSHCIPALGIPTVLTGKALFPPSGEPIYTDTYVSSHGGLGITIEAGWLETLNPKTIIANLIQALKALDVIDFEYDTDATAETPQEIQQWDAIENVIAGKNFTFTQDWQNFQPLPTEKPYAYNDGKPLFAPPNSIIIFPKPKHKIVPGQEACIIATKIAKE